MSLPAELSELVAAAVFVTLEIENVHDNDIVPFLANRSPVAS